MASSRAEKLPEFASFASYEVIGTQVLEHTRMSAFVAFRDAPPDRHPRDSRRQRTPDPDVRLRAGGGAGRDWAAVGLGLALLADRASGGVHAPGEVRATSSRSAFLSRAAGISAFDPASAERGGFAI